MSNRRVLLDAMLGTLATYLRICGYDAAYTLDRGVEDDDRLRSIASEEGRTLLTRDRALADSVGDALLVESRDVQEQLRELAAAGFDLTPAESPTRCGRCNGCLEPVDPGSGTPEYAPDPGEERVFRCRACGQHFWKGSHWDDVADTLSELCGQRGECRRL